jgi:hypothetical protein
METGIRLEVSGRLACSSLAEVNAALVQIGSQVWPLDLRGSPVELRRLLRQPALGESENERLKTHFLLPRERLLETITAAGRRPHVPDGGAMETLDTTHNVTYPKLWVKQPDTDYSRFDRFHVNVANDDTGVDEVIQMLSGRGLVFRHRLPGGEELVVHLDCPAEDTGWLVTNDGGRPHIGSLAIATPGTKVVVQVLGPSRWNMRYEDQGVVPG